ncbi:MAG TPA: XRE family transcriptional regulator [Acidimicrobiales bacterium]|nr:XRE family transcriptional regulator [Acidimicrobiales bacterium]
MKATNFRDLSDPVRMDPARRANIERHRQEALRESFEYNLGELRRLRAVTQVELAQMLGVKQPTISNIENAHDVMLSTLRGFVEALGGHIEIRAVFDDLELKIAPDAKEQAPA